MPPKGLFCTEHPPVVSWLKPRLLFTFTTLVLMILYGSAHIWAEPTPHSETPSVDQSSLSKHQIDLSQVRHKETIQHLGISEDPEHHLSITDVLHPSHTFDPHMGSSPNFGYSSSVYWVRFKVHNPSLKRIHRVLECAYPTVNELDLWVHSGDSLRKHVSSGMNKPFEHRDYDHPHFLFDLHLEAQEEVLITLRFFSKSASMIPLHLWHPTHLQNHITKHQYIMGLAAGGFFILIAYNLFLYSSLRDRSYLYYIFFLCSFLLYQLNVKGFAYHLLWPNHPEFGDQSLAFSVFASIASMVLFTNRVLDLKTYSPRISKLYKCILGLGILGMLSQWVFPYDKVVHTATLAAGLTAVTIFTSSIYFFLKKIPRSGYFLIGWIFLVFGSIFAAFKFLGWMEANFFTEYGIQIGAVFEATFFSLALADRIHSLRKSKIIEEQKLIASEEKNLALRKKNAIIREAHEQIESSLDYAKHTQASLVPPMTCPKLSTNEVFLLWKQRDKVGGDLPILEETHHGTFWGICDCTGHGVPGALLTMSVSACLKEIIHEEELHDPQQVIQRLNRLLKKRLNKLSKSNTNDDGLDMGLCYRAHQSDHILYSGARIPLFIRKAGSSNMQTLKASRQSVGYADCPDDYDYQQHKVIIESGDEHYLWSDGYVDQIGGPKGLPHGKKPLIKKLIELEHDGADDKRRRLLENFHQWKGQQPTLDDVILMGVTY